ncbi:MAG: dTDP-4-dehydrorhamnose 3,5-epimerase [Ignavibacteria bacterium]|nr:dTDP-4-dehydrorhamnose 3,5-epimerase [Ignavibacteria bacterium]MBT8382273.1 dTDP-4-dehydrorhamnose 3,5-epimerase [Ignavibacteria bacterium]MBT8390946.1 dTDP-4-dehydrorhamnose 3,5-epimerase [Ignavibacteria bacterium]NNJ51571.1 dTDP-4-dehydrorhamnose 3,5-epimerase [Ignavibacteriaceae bacterium]NNL19962.1 dTDP-4-dehydrorhamnose 3,5-epimerase [Ignavibacteriaceae bacterium]
MKVIKTKIDGLLIIEPDVFSDDRGFFLESFNKIDYQKHGLNFEFVQDNISKSVKNTIRGLHYQAGGMAQGKLCQVLIGKVLDVAVDIRFGSPTFGNHYTHVLNSDKLMQIWVPPGLAHGFSVLSEDALFAYKCTSYYSKEHERTILYNDAELNINWKVNDPIVSEKDLNAVKFKDIEKDFIYTAK